VSGLPIRQLGTTGVLVSGLGLGTNNFGTRLEEAASHAVLDRAVEFGITLVDTADVYGFGETERIIGNWLVGRRDEVVLATKAGMDQEVGGTRIGSTALHLKRSVEESLTRLRTDHIDLLQLHIGDPITPIEETLRAVDDLIRCGKVRYVGVSNFMAWELARAAEVSRAAGFTAVATVQAEYSLLRREIEDELVPASAAYGISVLAYRPLARGVLTGKYRADEPPPPGTRLALQPAAGEGYVTSDNLRLVDTLAAFARDRGHTLLDLSLAWLLAQPRVASVLVGASSPEQLEANVAGASWTIPEEDVRSVATLLPPPIRADLGQSTLRRSRPGAGS
jgi:aryl-alcohol dehydrogenase-like predicted oxidoreductase